MNSSPLEWEVLAYDAEIKRISTAHFDTHYHAIIFSAALKERKMKDFAASLARSVTVKKIGEDE